MKYRTTRAVRFAGRAYADNDPIPHPDDLPGAAALFDNVRGELVDMGAVVADKDAVESQTGRRDDLLRQLAEVCGSAEPYFAVVAPTEPGDYVMKVGPFGIDSISPFLDVDPLADADEATIRRHHLDALRELGDDVTYLALTDDVAGKLGETAIFTVDSNTGVVVAVEPRSSAPTGGEVTTAPAAGTGEAIQPPGAVDGDRAAVPPVIPPDPAPSDSVTRRGGRRPKPEADQ